MKIDSQSMAVAPQWGQISSKGATAIDWQSIFIIVAHDFVIDDGGLEMYVVGSS